MTNFKIIYQENKSEAVNYTFIKALTKGLAEQQFNSEYSDCIILNIEG